MGKKLSKLKGKVKPYKAAAEKSSGPSKRPVRLPALKKAQAAKAVSKAKVTGKGGRNAGGKANVTKEQLAASGLSLGAYLNKFDKTGKRPGAKKAAPSRKTSMTKSTKSGPTPGPTTRPAKSKSTSGPTPGPTTRGKKTPAPVAKTSGSSSRGGARGKGKPRAMPKPQVKETAKKQASSAKRNEVVKKNNKYSDTVGYDKGEKSRTRKEKMRTEIAKSRSDKVARMAAAAKKTKARKAAGATIR
jgi:hypothetical protein